MKKKCVCTSERRGQFHRDLYNIVKTDLQNTFRNSLGERKDSQKLLPPMKLTPLVF